VGRNTSSSFDLNQIKLPLKLGTREKIPVKKICYALNSKEELN
jgi:hypothetical protein